MAAAEAEEGERQGYLDPDFLRLRAALQSTDNRGTNGLTSALVVPVSGSVEGLLVEAMGRYGFELI